MFMKPKSLPIMLKLRDLIKLTFPEEVLTNGLSFRTEKQQGQSLNVEFNIFIFEKDIEPLSLFFFMVLINKI